MTQEQGARQTNWGDRLFQLALLLVGFTLGVMSQLFWQQRTDARQRLMAATLLRYSIQQEIFFSEDNRCKIQEALDGKSQGVYWLKVFLRHHKPSLYEVILPQALTLDPEIVEAIIWFDSAINISQNYREICQQELESKNGTVDEEKLSTYIWGLGRVIEKGRRVLGVIDTHYPGIRKQQGKSPKQQAK